ncbi:MAG: DUF2946 domain-containing protein [Rhodoferax sp.]|nr:DUF2946 domain-containing protein [Rhodoferax sp.]
MKHTRLARPRLHRVCTAWLAAWLVLFAAVAPLVSHALALGTTSPGLEICTAVGPKTLVVTDDTTPVPPGNHLLAHCPFCLLHADRLALPSYAPQWLEPPLLIVRVVTPACVVTTPETPYNSAAPRGPPERS